MPLFCEPLADVRGGDVRRKVLEGVRRFGSLGADVLKIQFPGDPAADPSGGPGRRPAPRRMR